MRFILDIQFFAHKKGVGSSKNGRDSASKRLGQKLSDGQKCTAGAIIYRQRGTKIMPGFNVKRGGDDTLFALIDGIVKYDKYRGKTRANVLPIETSKDDLAAKRLNIKK
ncbi:MAG: 50S ribosomal protein L27 [Mycoplasmataceae bacterium]|nr:50S ribosomal protein L27 [Mycoplasmataceae bacterium]